MGTVRETAAAVRFSGDDLDPDEVTRLLGADPDVAYRKGDIGRNGRGATRTGVWSCPAPRRSPGDLDTQIAGLFAGMSQDLTVWADLGRRFRGDVFCGLFLDDSNEGISLSADTMRAISERGLKLDLDIYNTAD